MGSASSEVVHIRGEVLVVDRVNLVVGLARLLVVALFAKSIVIFGNLVTKLANRRNLDRARPIGVRIAQDIGKVLKFLLGHVKRLVQRNVVMSWCHTTLGCQLRHKEEIEAFVCFGVLDELGIEASSWLWIFGLITIVIDEHALIDAFVHHNQSDLGCFTISELLVEDASELMNLIVDAESSLLGAETITIDEDLIWIRTVDLFELVKGLEVVVIKITLNDLLAFCLVDGVLVELGTLKINRSDEANNRVFACMTNIDSNNHGLGGLHELGKLEVDRNSAKLAVHLLHDVRCYTHVDLLDCVCLDALAHHIQICEHTLDVLVVIFVVHQHDEEDVGDIRSVSVTSELSHDSLDGIIESLSVTQIRNLSLHDFLAVHAHLPLAVHEVVECVLNHVTIHVTTFSVKKDQVGSL